MVMRYTQHRPATHAAPPRYITQHCHAIKYVKASAFIRLFGFNC